MRCADFTTKSLVSQSSELLLYRATGSLHAQDRIDGSSVKVRPTQIKFVACAFETISGAFVAAKRSQIMDEVDAGLCKIIIYLTQLGDSRLAVVSRYVIIYLTQLGDSRLAVVSRYDMFLPQWRKLLLPLTAYQGPLPDATRKQYRLEDPIIVKRLDSDISERLAVLHL